MTVGDHIEQFRHIMDNWRLSHFQRDIPLKKASEWEHVISHPVYSGNLDGPELPCCCVGNFQSRQGATLDLQLLLYFYNRRLPAIHTNTINDNIRPAFGQLLQIFPGIIILGETQDFHVVRFFSNARAYNPDGRRQ